jgi:hypothetical protein
MQVSTLKTETSVSFKITTSAPNDGESDGFQNIENPIHLDMVECMRTVTSG